MQDTTPRCSGALPWNAMADRALALELPHREDLLAVLRSDDGQLLEILTAAYRVRRRWFGNEMHLNFLINAKSGACGEDCGYCSQSRLSKAEIPTYRLLDDEQILDGARMAAERKAKTYCIVTSGRGPSRDDLDRVARLVPRIKDAYPLKVCLSPGFLSAEKAAMLKAAGVDRINHNLNTSRRFYPEICTTHTFDDRLNTLKAVHAAGLEICSGGIIGMGETDDDVVDLAMTLGELGVEATPVNFFMPIPGTPLESVRRLNPRYCLKALVVFRLANPQVELRIAGGREMHLGSLQPLGLFVANSMFVGDYLTTKGQPAEDDFRMIEALGFEPVLDGTHAPQG